MGTYGRQQDSQIQGNPNDLFNGGGTNIENIHQQQQPQQLQPQQLQPQQLQPQTLNYQNELQAAQAQKQAMYEQYLRDQYRARQVQDKNMKKASKNSGSRDDNNQIWTQIEHFIDSFESELNLKWQTFLAIIILIILFNNAYIFEFEKPFIPAFLRESDSPPLIAVIFNAILIGGIVLIISKYS